MKAIVSLIWAGVVVGLTGCASALMGDSDRGRHVVLAHGDLSLSEALAYEELGIVNSIELCHSPECQESCRKDLRNRAADMGADVVMIEFQAQTSCWGGADENCYEMRGRAYRKRRPDLAASVSPTNSPT